MKTTLSLLAASTALALAVGLPARSATPALSGATDPTLPFVLASGDDDEGGQKSRAHDSESDDCDEDGGCAGAKGNPAPAGSVPPPANGLFGTGAPPAAATN